MYKVGDTRGASGFGGGECVPCLRFLIEHEMPLSPSSGDVKEGVSYWTLLLRMKDRVLGKLRTWKASEGRRGCQTLVHRS